MAKSWGKKKKLLKVVTSLVDCFTSCAAPTAPVWYTDRLCATCGVTSGTPQSPPFSCTTHAYRKRNKVYTQWCLCYIYFFLIFLNTFTPGKGLSGGSFRSCERGVCHGSPAAPSFPSETDILGTKLPGPDWWFLSPCELLPLCLERVWLGCIYLWLPAAGGFSSKRFNNTVWLLPSCVYMVMWKQRAAPRPSSSPVEQTRPVTSHPELVSAPTITHSTLSHDRLLCTRASRRNRQVSTRQQDADATVYLPLLASGFALLSYVLLSWYGVAMATNNRYWM